MANTIQEILGTAASIAKGMGVTFKEMMGPTVTDDYPDAPPKFEERFRGVHVLQRDVNGMEKCVACFLCAAACPSNAITHGHGFEAASYNTATLVKRKEDMLAAAPAGAQPPAMADRLPAGAH